MRRSSVVLAVLTAIFCYAGTGAFATNALHHPQDDGKALLPLVASYYEGHPSLIVRYYDTWGSYTNEKELMDIGRKLSGKLHLPAGTLELHGQLHPVYSVTAVLEQRVAISLRLAGVEENHSLKLFISLETADPNGVDSLQARKQAIENIIRTSSKPFVWNTMIQGELRPNVNPDDVVLHVQAQLAASEIARYRDHGTTSISYSASSPLSKIKSGHADMNMQIAFHQHSETKRWRFTIGTPLITTDY